MKTPQPPIPHGAIIDVLRPRRDAAERPAGRGACSCPAGTNFAACECAWGALIRRMLQLGYGREADAATLARELPALGATAVDVTSGARKAAIGRLARGWQGPASSLARYLGVSFPALKAAAPDAVRTILERRGTR